MSSYTKLQAEIIFLSHIITQGYCSKSVLDDLLDKISGKLPLGANAPTFKLRKYIVISSVFLNAVQYWFFGLLSSFFATWCLVLSFASYFDPYYLLGGSLLVIVGIFLFYFCIQRLRIIPPLLKLQQQQPDPEPVFVAIQDSSRYASERRMSQFLGISIMCLIAGLMYWIYHQSNQFLPKIIILLPFCFMFGLGMLISPLSKSETRERFGRSQIPWKYLPTAMKICLSIGFILMLINLWLLLPGQF